MRCTEPKTTRTLRDPRRPRGLLLALALAGSLFVLTGCATRPAPVPATPSTPMSAATPGPAAARPAAPALPPPTAARSWDEFKLSAGRRLVAAHPGGTFMSTPPDMLFGIPVIETELHADGTVKSIGVLRRPSDPAAADTVQLAVDAIRRAAPYGDMTRLSKPWKWVEVFLFNEQRQFKPRSLD